MKLGIIGLPNVGKSTLFNAITGAGAQSANYPFCTIDPNVGVVAVPDKRLDVLAEMYNPQKYTPAIIEFVDIAGLVRGASKGEGLGNKFLSHIRDVDAVVHVVRCFENDDIIFCHIFIPLIKRYQFYATVFEKSRIFYLRMGRCSDKIIHKYCRKEKS